jgi:hypothetical protein
MADRTTKAISEVKPGDMVLATDPGTGEQGPREVTDLIVHDDYLTDLVLDNGDVIVTTEDHPFWNATDRQWQRADKLTGGTILSLSGRRVRVVGTRTGPAAPAPAYNLTVADLHTYYVLTDDTPVLVHNCPEYVGKHRSPGDEVAPDRAHVPRHGRSDDVRGHRDLGPVDRAMHPLRVYGPRATSAVDEGAKWGDGSERVGSAVGAFFGDSQAGGWIGKIIGMIWGGIRGWRS